MTKLLINALQAITNRTNLSTVLAHPNDMNAAKKMFVLLNNEGEDLIAVDIESWATRNGWQLADARELGLLAESIWNGKKVRIQNRPWWAEDIIEQLKK